MQDLPDGEHHLAGVRGVAFVVGQCPEMVSPGRCLTSGRGPISLGDRLLGRLGGRFVKQLGEPFVKQLGGPFVEQLRGLSVKQLGGTVC